MATDPYHAVQHEVQTSLQAASTLRASYLRIRSTARGESEELVWARNELKATLAALEADLEDLEESVKIVEQTGARMFGLEEREVLDRRAYVSRVRREIQDIRSEIDSDPASKRNSTRSTSSAALNGGGGRGSDDDEDHQAKWAQEEQAMIMREQDATIDTIAGTLSTLAQQAGLMGQEVEEHNELLTDLEQGVDRTSSRLDSSMKKLQKFIRDTEETKSGWCILILTIILLVLLLAVILI